MLHLYLDEIPDGMEMVNDVEELFSTLELSCTNEEKEVVRLIEQGELIDGHSFIDRFGYKLYTSELSTGCKAALCVLNIHDKIINLTECGFNARDVILVKCKEGAVFTWSNTITISNSFGEKLEVELDGYSFTTVSGLNTYIFDERLYKPDMSSLGKGDDFND